MATYSLEELLTEAERQDFTITLNPPDAIDFCKHVKNHFPAVFDAVVAKFTQRRLAEAELRRKLGGAA